MSSLDDRGRGEEAKYAFDAEKKFKAEVRRNKLLGAWAADLLGLTGDAATAYAAEVVAADFERAGDSDVLDKVSRRRACPSMTQRFARRWISSQSPPMSRSPPKADCQ